LDDDVIIENSVIGPHVSIGAGTKVTDCRISNSIIQKSSTLREATLKNSLLGNFVNFEGKSADIDLGDFSTI
jgi:glucose-1-phosphate thymidylyltransferase